MKHQVDLIFVFAIQLMNTQYGISLTNFDDKIGIPKVIRSFD